MTSSRLPMVLSSAAFVLAATAVAQPVVAKAFDAKNADKVDGKHAVAAKATPAKRKGRLVATDKAGLLPNNIIAKAPDADRLDGLSSEDLVKTSTATQQFVQSTTKEFVRSTAPAGKIFAAGQLNTNGTLAQAHSSYTLVGSDFGLGNTRLTVKDYLVGRACPEAPKLPFGVANRLGRGSATQGVVICEGNDLHVHFESWDHTGGLEDATIRFILFEPTA